MDMKIPLLLLLLISIISPSHSLASLDANSTELLSFYNLFSSTVLPITEERARGEYTVSLKIGNHVKPFNLNIDTGSDLTWVQCDYDDKCEGCTLPKDNLYKPDENFVTYGTPLCDAVQKEPNSDSSLPCEYDEEYVDSLEVQGYLVKDTLRSTQLAFGCSNKLKVSDKGQTIPEGILGLGYGEASILSQLKSQGLIQNVVGHCIKKGGGYIFFGDNFIPKSPTEISWTPILSPSINNKVEEGRYFAGPADLLFNEELTSIRDLDLMFDCGTTRSYLTSKYYGVLLNLINEELNSKEIFMLTKLDSLICWKGQKTFNSIAEVSNDYLKPIVLRFPESNVEFQLLVEHYMTVRRGHICLLIEDGTVNGVDDNIIGAISMSDKIMIFDNEINKIGWVPDDCT